MRLGRGHRGVVLVFVCVCVCMHVCHENPADAARWGSETKLKEVIPCVFREIAHSSLIMYFSHRKPGKLIQTPSTKPASCSRKGKEDHNNGIRMWRK